MNIGFDISQASDKTAGCGVLAKYYAYELLRKDTDLNFTFYGTFGPNFCDPDINLDINSNNINNQLKFCFNNKNQAKEFWLQENIENKIDNPDIIHCNNFWCPPNINKAKIIYTLYDFSFLEFPEYANKENINICLNGLISAVQNADHFVAISNYTKTNFLEYFPFINENKVSVIYPGFKPINKKQYNPKNKMLEKNNFFLTVGTIEPRKNHIRLIKSYSLYFKKTVKHSIPKQLIIVGANGWGNIDLIKLIKLEGLEDFIKIIGYVDELLLSWLYSNCYCNVYVSLFEGFGLPVLEGMKHGTPTITSNISSIPEIADKSAILINPLNEEDISNALFTIDNDINFRNHLADNAIKDSLKFDWSLSVDKLLNLYEKIL